MVAVDWDAAVGFEPPTAPMVTASQGSIVPAQPLRGAMLVHLKLRSKYAAVEPARSSASTSRAPHVQTLIPTNRSRPVPVQLAP